MRLALLPLFVLAACAPDLREDFPFDGDLPPGEYVFYEDQGGGITRVSVNASNKESWVYWDIDGLRAVPTGEALELHQWDLGFQRFKIMTNSGVSGLGDVGVAALPGQSFEGLTGAPASGYLQDRADSADDSDQDLDSAFLVEGGWYYYDLGAHKLTPRDVSYVVRSSEGAFFRLRMLGYYDENGSSARPSFLVSRLPDSN